MYTSSYDIIIVGARPAGASLALRLGRMGHRVLLLDKDTFPSKPAMSSPAIFASTMELLDELGIEERIYAKNTPKISSFVIHIRDVFSTNFNLPVYNGRNYVYCIDRERFDQAILDQACANEQVTFMEGFTVQSLVWEGEKVCGVVGRDQQKQERSFLANYVIGADGRYSTVAKLVQAPVLKAWNRSNSAVLYAYWKGAKPAKANRPFVEFYLPVSGLLYMVMDSADGSTCVVIHGEKSRVYCKGTAKESYAFLLDQVVEIKERLIGAQAMDKLRGVKNLKNIYKEAGGNGWFLTGDAIHHRDTLDAQGIYEALLTSKLLAETLSQLLHGTIQVGQAVRTYQDAVLVETEAMCKATLSRLVWEHRIPWPHWFLGTFFKWLFSNPEYRSRFLQLHLREIDPQNWLTIPLILRSVWRGISEELSKHTKKAA